MTVRIHDRVAWADQFLVPTQHELRSGLGKHAQAVLDCARLRLLDHPRVTESTAWHGVPWRWTLVYSVPQGKPGFKGGPSPALAYIVPEPTRLQMCVPLDVTQIESLPIRTMSKGLREGILVARSVAGVWWGTWEIPSKSALEEVLTLVSAKHELVVEIPRRRAIRA